MAILLDLLAWLQIKGWLPIYLHLIFGILQFEISSLMNWIFLPAVVCKIQVHQTGYFKLENYKNRVQIDRRLV